MTELPLQEISLDVLLEKYAKDGESTIDDVRRRIATALASVETPQRRAHWAAAFHQAQCDGFIAGGRIASAAGTELEATLINCFVQPLHDAISWDGDRIGIFPALNEAAETMRRGGGVGYDFSALRPRGARVRGTGSQSSGPVSYMQIFDRMCETVESAGARRGAQMGVLRCDHPDIEAFVAAKDDGGLHNFNLSVACTDAFMQAVERDEDWELLHAAEPGAERIAAGAHRRADGQWVYQVVRARKLFGRIVRSTYDHAEPGVVFIDTVNRDNNLGWLERIATTNPCGEQPLPPYGCCDLGSIDLTRFVGEPFAPGASFDFDRFEALVPIAVRMLDNVLDLTRWPVPAQAREAHAKRRIGLGFTGLGDALAMLGLRFDTPPARAMAARIAERMRDAAYGASVELAREKGAFPLFDPARYGQPPSAASRLPRTLLDDIRRAGIRNSHLLSIAPTGTISLAFADNASNGIEPPFSWTYRRNKRTPDGVRTYVVEDHAYRLFRHRFGLAADVELRAWGDASAPRDGLAPGAVFERDGRAFALLPPAFVTALEISALDHARMSIAVQPFVDSAISKTVNVPVDYPFESFEDLYLEAWRGGLKGLTTYRPNATLGAVLQPLEAGRDTAVAPSDLDLSPLDARIRLLEAPRPALASLRWPGRPELPGGNPSWTCMVRHPLGDFAVFIGHLEEADGNYPFEVWVNGAEQPRGLGAIAKTLSMDMRTDDRGWLDMKLRALEKAQGDDAFEMSMPPDGRKVPMPSLVAGFARLVRYRCDSLGAFADAGRPTPVLDALIGRREPKAGPDGTMSWTVDVMNPATGDDFAMFLKELEMPDGQRRPYSLWMSGEYPRAFDGLCKALSLDMWVLDPAWIGMKLRKLLNYAEAAGEFRARVPGSDRTQLWPSTIAYVAQLMLHRYRMLGILDETGVPIAGQSLLTMPSEPPDDLGVRPLPGRRCEECGNRSVIRRDGCDFCTACGRIGACG